MMPWKEYCFVGVSDRLVHDGQVGQPSPESVEPDRAAGDDDDDVGHDRGQGEPAQGAAGLQPAGQRAAA